MNCPICLSVMYDNNYYNYGFADFYGQEYKVLELLCHNSKCKTVTARPLKILSYMQVLTKDPEPWKCYRYSLAFEDNEEYYVLQGRPSFEEDKWETKLLKSEWVKLAPQPSIFGNFIDRWGTLNKILVSVD